MKNTIPVKQGVSLISNKLRKAKKAFAMTILTFSTAVAWAATDAVWNPTGSMSIGRFSFTATILQNGKVLVAGGDTPGEIVTNTANLYDPTTGVFTSTGNMAKPRVGFSATRLSNGKVLAAGGATDTEGATNTAEIYDPATGTWSTTGSMKQGRQQHSAVLLRDGTVLVSGGNIDRTPCTDVCVNTIAESEIYNPSNGQWKAVGDMTIPRSFFTTTLLSNGKALAVGGRIHTGPDYFDYKAIAWVDLYDPATRKWSATGTMSISREDHSAVLLNNGKVLVTGGTTVDFNGVTVASAELYDPATGTWATTGNMLQGRERFTATLLQNDKVLVAGGDYYDGVNAGFLTECELYDPILGTWSATASMTTPRFGAQAVLLRNGKVLEAGGETDFTDTPTALAELYNP